MPVVMLVEDDRSTRESLCAALEDSDLEVISASSGEEAKSRLQLTPVDVIVSDIMMGESAAWTCWTTSRSTTRTQR